MTAPVKTSPTRLDRALFLRQASSTMVHAPSTATLDALRAVGDPPLDDALRDWIAENGPAGLFAKLGESGESEHPVLRAIPQVSDLGDRAAILRGQRLFDVFSPEIMLALGSCSLPLTYAAGNGVQVISRTQRLGTDPAGRLRNTARMVAAVMQPWALEPGRIGAKSARKVRLVHAVVRHQLQSLRDPPWPAEWGVPINQEDLAGTLLSFSVAVLHAVRRLGARVSPEEGDAYVVAWSAAGRILGLRPELLVHTEAEGLALFHSIARRQFRSTPEGRELTGTLLRTSDRRSPLRGSATAWVHYFLRDPLLGADVAELLGVPPANWTRWVVELEVLRKRAFLASIDRVPGARAGRGLVGRYLVDRLLLRDAS